jgi:hypothetical protein
VVSNWFLVYSFFSKKEKLKKEKAIRMDWLPDVTEKKNNMLNLLMKELNGQMVRYLERKFQLEINDGKNWRIIEGGGFPYDNSLICFRFGWVNGLNIYISYHFYGNMWSDKNLKIEYFDEQYILYESQPVIINQIERYKDKLDEETLKIIDYFLEDDFIIVSNRKYFNLYDSKNYYHNLQSATTFLLICKSQPIFPKDIYLIIAKKILFFLFHKN